MTLPTRVEIDFGVRSKAISLRISPQTYKQLQELVEKTKYSQADIISYLIDKEHKESGAGKRSKGAR